MNADLLHEPSDFLTQLPRGRHGLPPAFVAQNQRERLAAAAIAIGAGRGYDETTVSEIVAAAHLSRRTFYDHFSGKPQCFLAARALIAEHLGTAVRSAAEAEQKWARRIRSRFDVALGFFAANPDLARFLLAVPLRTEQPDLVAAHRRFLGRAAGELASGGPQREARSSAFERALLAGLAARILAAVEAEDGARLPGLGPELTEIYLLAFDPGAPAE